MGPKVRPKAQSSRGLKIVDDLPLYLYNPSRFEEQRKKHMAVMIRMSRQGAKKKPNYIVVAVDKMAKRDGAYLARLGQYFPKAKDPKDKLKIDQEALSSWIAKGAQLSQTVGQLLKSLSK